jgi:hypothetical protein
MLFLQLAINILLEYIIFLQKVVVLLSQHTQDDSTEGEPSSSSHSVASTNTQLEQTTRDTVSQDTPTSPLYDNDEEEISRLVREDSLEYRRSLQISANEQVLGHGYRYCSRSYPCRSLCRASRPCRATTTTPPCTATTPCGHLCSGRQPCGYENPRTEF